MTNSMKSLVPIVGMHDVITLYFDASKNCFLDEDGTMVFDIYETIKPSDYEMFLYYETDLIVPHCSVSDLDVELIFPREDGRYYEKSIGITI